MIKQSSEYTGTQIDINLDNGAKIEGFHSCTATLLYDSIFQKEYTRKGRLSTEAPIDESNEAGNSTPIKKEKNSLSRRKFVGDPTSILILGGEDEDGLWTNELKIVDLRRGLWRIFKWDFPRLNSHTSVYHKDNIYVFGGSSDVLDTFAVNKELYVIKLIHPDGNNEPTRIQYEKITPTTDVRPPPRQRHSCISTDKQLIVFGGFDYEPQPDLYVSTADPKKHVYRDCYLYDIRYNKWIPLNRGKVGLYGHTAVFDRDSNRMIVFGGRDAESQLRNNVYVLSLVDRSVDQANANWTTIECGGHLPPPRERHSSCITKSHLIIYGGWTIGGPKADCYQLDLNSYQWTKILIKDELLRTPRFAHSAVFHPFSGKMYILGGKSEVFKSLSSVDSHEVDKVQAVSYPQSVIGLSYPKQLHGDPYTFTLETPSRIKSWKSYLPELDSKITNSKSKSKKESKKKKEKKTLQTPKASKKTLFSPNRSKKSSRTPSTKVHGK
mmetsp:Transcript_6998/g.10267  ORF Transcript_6998/g.10267 Transcript_6998/m.10267 type:complete len:494 (+) Transcript_6998:27-1508(+)